MKAKKKYKNNQGSYSQLIWILAALVVLYLIIQMISGLYNKIETTKAVEVTENDSILTTGCFIREESLVPEADSESVEYLVKDGSRIKKGEPLAVEYNNENALEINSQITELQDQVEILKTVKDNLNSLSDPQKLDQLIKMQILTLEDNLHRSNLSGVDDEAKELKELVLKRNLTSQDSETVEAKITKLQDQINTLKKKAGKAKKTISSPYSGYFSEAIDGYEGILKASEIDNLTPSSLRKLLNQEPKIDEDSMGKIMDNFSWYFAAFVDTKDLNGLEEGDTLSLRFNQVSNDVTVTVYRIVQDDAGNLIILQGNTVNSELLSMRKQSVEMIRNTYTGIKIPKDAVRMVNDKLGVYILSGSISRFKPITTIYEGDHYYLIKQGSTNDTGVVVGDNIIVKSKDIEDKKVVK